MGVGREESKCGENRWWNLLGSELCVRVPLASQQEVKDVRIVSFGDYLFNWVAAIEKSSGGTINVADGGFGADYAGETRAERLFVAHRRGRLSTNSSANRKISSADRKITEPSSATKTDPVKPPGSP